MSLTSTLTGLSMDTYAYIGCSVAGVAAGSALTWAMATRRIVAPKNGRSRKVEDLLTFTVAAIAAGVSAQGMWRFFGDVLKFPEELRVVSLAVLELAALVCGLRARKNVADKEIGEAGIDGIAVWVIAAVSAVFSALDSRSLLEAPARAFFPLLAAWLWERGLSPDRRRNKKRIREIHWRVTPERLLVKLGIAEPTERTVFEVDAHRRLTAVAKAAMKLRALRAAGVWHWRQKRARLCLERAMQRAVEHAGLATSPERQQDLLAQIGALVNAATLAEVDARAPWLTATSDPKEGPHSPEPPAAQSAPRTAIGTPWGGLALPGHSAPAAQVSGLDDAQVTGQVSDLSSRAPRQVTSGSPAQVTPPGATQGTDKSMTRIEGEVTPAPERQATPQVTRQGAGRGRVRRTDEELIEELQKIVNRCRDNGEQVAVKPIAEELSIGRDRCRVLLDRMNVRPIPKAANQ